MARILAFDYGLKRVGVAVTDPLQMIANSLPTIATTEVIAFTKQYLSKEEVEAFVVGYPVHYGTSRNNLQPHIDKFIKQLQQLFPGKPVHKVDERFTSVIASQTLRSSGVNRTEMHKKGNIDAISANIILQSYLEMKQ